MYIHEKHISFGRCISCSFGVQPTLQGRCLEQTHLCRAKRKWCNGPTMTSLRIYALVLFMAFIASELHQGVFSVRKIFDRWPLIPSRLCLRLTRMRKWNLALWAKTNMFDDVWDCMFIDELSIRLSRTNPLGTVVIFFADLWVVLFWRPSRWSYKGKFWPGVGQRLVEIAAPCFATAIQTLDSTGNQCLAGLIGCTWRKMCRIDQNCTNRLADINGYYWLMVPAGTAQGSGGSFKDRKPIGEVRCCEFKWLID